MKALTSALLTISWMIEVSIGDYVLTNGALAALVVTDAIVRLIPGVLGDPDSAAQDRSRAGLLDHPHYTRPEDFRRLESAGCAGSGNHAAIEAWRKQRHWNHQADGPTFLKDREMFLCLALNCCRHYLIRK